MDHKRIGRRIKAFRKLKGYTQINFAKELDIPLSILGAVERGAEIPSNELLEIIVKKLVITKEELITDSSKEGS